MLVGTDIHSKVYPTEVRKYLMGLYATLHLTDECSAKDMEKVIYYAFRNGYALGVASQGGDAEKATNMLPDYDGEFFT